jgi:phage replication-related protein YjqB (UPF0714/DUF867 family)
MSKDMYPSLVSLKKHLRKDEDYRIRIADRHADVTILAPHGGFIEPGSSVLARAIAASEHNLFDFQGLNRQNPMDLHVTATRFRDSQLTGMLKRSRVALSIHGMGNQGHTDIWLGGRNQKLKALVLRRLTAAGFTVNPDSPQYRGESPQNVVNLAPEAGVQLELTFELVSEMFQHSRFLKAGRRPRTTSRFQAFVDAIRAALASYQQAAADGAS